MTQHKRLHSWRGVAAGNSRRRSSHPPHPPPKQPTPAFPVPAAVASRTHQWWLPFASSVWRKFLSASAEGLGVELKLQLLRQLAWGAAPMASPASPCSLDTWLSVARGALPRHRGRPNPSSGGRANQDTEGDPGRLLPTPDKRWAGPKRTPFPPRGPEQQPCGWEGGGILRPPGQGSGRRRQGPCCLVCSRSAPSHNAQSADAASLHQHHVISIDASAISSQANASRSIGLGALPCGLGGRKEVVGRLLR